MKDLDISAISFVSDQGRRRLYDVIAIVLKKFESGFDRAPKAERFAAIITRMQ
jgi:hypothetical protein